MEISLGGNIRFVKDTDTRTVLTVQPRGDIIHACTLNCAIPLTLSTGDIRYSRGPYLFSMMAYMVKLKTIAMRYFQRFGRHVCLHVAVDCSGMLQFRIHGFLWQDDEKHMLLKGGAKLKMTIDLTIKFDLMENVTEWLELEFTAPLTTDAPLRCVITGKSEFIRGEFEWQSECIFLPSLTRLVKEIAKDPRFGNRKCQVTGTIVSLDLVFENDEEFDAHAFSTINRNILKNEQHTDLSIESGQQTVIKCHKSFLAARSPVLDAMFKSGMSESKNEELKLNDMTHDGVKALLAYIYWLGLEEPRRNCDIALELLQAAHKYKISTLEEKMKTLIPQKPSYWFNAEMALKLFLFANNVEEFGDIKRKLLEFVECELKSKEMADSELLKSVFRVNPEVALDLYTSPGFDHSD